MISVICPIYNEERYIARCIDSILAQDYPKGDMEVLFVDGMSSDSTREIVDDYVLRYSFIRLLDNPHKIVPYAMNIGIAESRGDIIIRIDAHTFYERNYFSELVKHLCSLGADNVGAVCKTDVLNKTAKTLAIREVLGHKFGVGNSVFRTGVDRIMEVDTVPFGCWRRDVFDRYGLYDTRLVRNQDIELNKRILRDGGKIFIIPSTFCTYLARETFGALAKNNYANGKWNVLTVYYTKQFDSLSIRHFIPLLFVLSLIVPFILGVFYWPLMLLSVVSLLLYSTAVVYMSVLLSIKRQRSFKYLVSSFFVLHLSYGVGSMSGILKFLCK